MNDKRHSSGIFRTWRLSGIGILVGMLCIGLGPGWGEDRPDKSSGTSSPGRQKSETDESLLIGGGIRRPPDIGAAGTASPTPPVRSESPTDEPDLLPSRSPVSSDPFHSQDASPAPGVREVEPLGDPEFIKEYP